jgi:cupin fold WbuC family metalloprotein
MYNTNALRIMEIIDEGLLNSVSESACKSPRLRMNYNFHKSVDAKAQRLLNAMEPGTVMPVHRHQNTEETYILIRGSLRVFFYNDKQELIETGRLNLQEGKYGINIPVGQWHTIEVLESGTIILEVKEGPYRPLKAEDILK